MKSSTYSRSVLPAIETSRSFQPFSRITVRSFMSAGAMPAPNSTVSVPISTSNASFLPRGLIVSVPYPQTNTYTLLPDPPVIVSSPIPPSRMSSPSTAWRTSSPAAAEYMRLLPRLPLKRIVAAFAVEGIVAGIAGQVIVAVAARQASRRRSLLRRTSIHAFRRERIGARTAP